MLYHQKYESEAKAREEAKQAYERVTAIWRKESCMLFDDPDGHAVVLVHPDMMQGVSTSKYEW